MQINEELKEKLIEEYIKKKSAELKEADKKEYKITYGYLLGGFFLFFSLLACIHQKIRQGYPDLNGLN